MRYVVDFLYLIFMLLYTPMLLWRMAVQGKWRGGWAHRFGAVPRRQGAGPCIWIHAVSVGEANATVTLAARLREALPGCTLAFSATTDTGFARLAKLYPDDLRFHYPLDFSLAVSRAFRRIRPAMIVLMELEVWPNLLGLARRAGIPVVVANGRLSDHSFRWYRRFRPVLRPMFRRLSAACVQDQAYADRFVAMGTPTDRVTVTASVKYDTAEVADRVAGADALSGVLGLDASHRLLVAGSTGPGEETILLDVYRRLGGSHGNLRLAIIPRKPERFDEVAALIAKAGFGCLRRSEHADGSPGPSPLAGDTVVLGDTMGELRKFYALSAIAFVGRSLVPMGGSDVMEAAALGLPVLTGPHADNFVEPVRRLSSGGGLIVVPDGDALGQAVAELLADEPRRKRMATAAREAVVQAKGATDRTVAVIRRLMES
ncbi:MAG: 3-deoxy-D-manno-octulosonic acid transferase [Phycisphaerae bacterium]|nr:3-deoxy-D-manno-octulosonic acid transferase [Phycisphaerae bacterium]